MPTNLPSNSDAELIQQSRDGDQSAYGQIVRRYQSLVCSVAYNRCGDLATSEDLAQDAFIQAWEKLADLNDVTKFKAWICTIVRNMANRSNEKATRNIATRAARLDSVVEPSSAVNDPSQRIISAEQEQLVWQALTVIPENYREPMILFYREEQSVARVAQALDISQDAVKQRLSRGRKFLQQQLAATVEATLKNSKPSEEFTGAVMLGLAGIKAKTAAVGVASVAAKAASGSGLAWSLLPLSHLPLFAWLFKLSWDDARSPTERQIWIRWTAIWMLTLIPCGFLLYAASFLELNKFLPSGFSQLPFFVVQLLYFVPMIMSARRTGKRVEQLRIQENTATPYGTLANPEKRGSTTRLFVGSGLLVVLWPAIISIVAADWISVGILMLTAVIASLVGARFCGKTPVKSFQVYGASLGVISLTGIAVMYFRVVWEDSFWFIGTLQAIAMTQAILSVVVWKRVFGKPN